jgi:hypothetical protein
VCTLYQFRSYDLRYSYKTPVVRISSGKLLQTGRSSGAKADGVISYECNQDWCYCNNRDFIAPAGRPVCSNAHPKEILSSVGAACLNDWVNDTIINGQIELRGAMGCLSIALFFIQTKGVLSTV